MTNANAIDRTDSTGSEPRVFSGTDIVSIQRIADLLTEFGESFVDRIFTEEEQEYCERQAYSPQHYAARWAAKESFLKLLGEPSPSVPASEIGVVSNPQPTLSLSRHAETALSSCLAEGVSVDGIDRSVSLSHDRDSGYAIAHVIVVVPGTVDR